METTVNQTTIKPRQKTKAVAAIGPKYNVFIVEDNQTSQMFLENYLQKMPNHPQNKKPNLEIKSFETGEQCLKAMETLRPDIVILDYYLDETDPNAINGLETLKKIKAYSPSTKVIIMSGQENVMITAELYNKGASDYISKEHYGIVRVAQSLLRLINEIEIERKNKTKNAIYGLLVLLIGFALGLLI
ncbi:MAG: response regulator [Flavobacteriales bacterium]|nr:response regulator [Flavobacteriales bacterium]